MSKEEEQEEEKGAVATMPRVGCNSHYEFPSYLLASTLIRAN